jgi:transposase
VAGHLLTDSGLESGVKKTQPATCLNVKTLLNRVQPFPGFVYRSIHLLGSASTQRIEIKVSRRAGSKGQCSNCRKRCSGYDTLPERRWKFVPLWAIPVFFLYAERRVECSEHGVIVEQVPWSVGKSPVSIALMIFLAQWARRLSWRETARIFATSWESVYRSVQWFVGWGLEHRVLGGIQAIGVDEIFWGRGRRSEAFLTRDISD